jgi:alpha-L-fucosidase
VISKNARCYFRSAAILFVTLLLFCCSGFAQDTSSPTQGSLNKPERLEWFRDQGFGIFIHWSVDSQLGVAISHSLVDASPAYQAKFFGELPQTFDPYKFNADGLADLIELSGARYAVFTTKHHSGFAMFSTSTTTFGIMNTPFHRDVTGEFVTALHKRNLAAGLYFSPDDFHWLYEHSIPTARSVPQVQFKANPALLLYDQQQVRELLTQYGLIDLIFFDGEAQGLRNLAWKLQPDVVVTRGAMETPEQYIPGSPLSGPWEACITMGTAWQYQPQHETYKSGTDLIRLLIQTRARGGNLLLNIGPKPDGELPIEEEERLREIGLWMFVNSEAIYDVRPWNITNENDIWFTSGHDGSTLYAIVDRPWERGTWLDLVLQSVRATPQTQISVLGQSSKVFEYRPEVDPTPSWNQQGDGLHIHAMRTQRLQDNSAWPNPAVIRLTHVEKAFTPPIVHTEMPVSIPLTNKVELKGEWQNPGIPVTVELEFQFRATTGEDKNSRTAPWQLLPLSRASKPGDFSALTEALKAGTTYEIRAVVRHPFLIVYGEPVSFTVDSSNR